MFIPPRLLLVLVSATLVGCGGGGGGGYSGGGGGGGGGGSPVPNVSVTANDTTENTARISDLNSLRGQCGGTALASVTSLNPLIISAVRHAGWQAIDDATQPNHNLNHYEPRSNSLYSGYYPWDRVKAANGGVDISGYYMEDIASTAGSTAINQLWNSVYHRIPMMLSGATNLGYGDMAMARSDYSTAGVPTIDEWGNTPSGNGYATLDWAGASVSSVSLSYWPKNGTTGVPPVFNSDQESPDPVNGRNQVGCPIHVVFPETAGTFTAVSITLVNGATHIPLTVLVGNASPSGAAGDVSSLTQDPSGLMDPGQLFAIPTPAPTNTGLSPNTSYTYSVSVTLNSNTYTVSNVTFTTGP